MMQLTEELLSGAFESVLGNGAWAKHYPRFARLVPELECQQGRPDFVASTTTAMVMPRSQRQRLSEGLASPAAARVLPLAKPASPRTEEYLVRESGLSEPVARRSLRTLCSLGLLQTTAHSTYILEPNLSTDRWELWAFELKLHDWRRGLYQALQYRAFAHRAVVVVSENWAHRAVAQKDTFRRLKVGLMALDVDSGSLRLIVRPPKDTPSSRFHHLYALGQFLARRTPVLKQRRARAALLRPGRTS